MKKLLSGILITLLLSSNVVSQPKVPLTEKSKRPKVGLVLSGGGAKGLAHIGVLKVLEEAGIHPDIITGTSMGSIVGCLYASGYSAEQLSEINANANWKKLLTDNVLLEKVAIDEKRETDKYLFNIPFHEKKINLPEGLIEGQHLENYFSELLWPHGENENFEQLPISFHCMSVDLVSGKVIEHKNGNLVKAIRSSMAIPTIFSPVRLDSMLLVDGGVLRNFPVQEAIDMGADIIIGVYVGFDEQVNPDELSSMTAILSRATALGGIMDAREQFQKCDLLIIPDLGDFSAGDFTKGVEIEKLGEDAARKHLDEIKALAARYQLHSNPKPHIIPPHKVWVTNYEVQGLEYLDKKYVLSKSGLEKNDSLSHRDIEEAIEFMYGTRQFAKLTYSLKKNQDNSYTVIFQAKENPRGMLRLAPSYDDDLGVGIVTNFTLRNILSPASRFLFSVNIAENPGFELSLNNYMGKRQKISDCFFARGYNYKLAFYNNGNRLGSYEHSYLEMGYGLKYSVGLNHQIGADTYYSYDKIKPQSDLQAIFDQANFRYFKTHNWAVRAFYRINSTDDIYFPTKGINFEALYAHSFSTQSDLRKVRNVYGPFFIAEQDEPYSTIVVQHNWYQKLARPVIFQFGVHAGFSSHSAGANGLFLLGGAQMGQNRMNYINLAGFNLGEMYTNNFTAVKSGLSIRISKGFYFSSLINIANTGTQFEDLFDDLTDKNINDYIWGYNIGLKYDSLLGPIQFLMARNNSDGKTRFHFSLGFPF